VRHVVPRGAAGECLRPMRWARWRQMLLGVRTLPRYSISVREWGFPAAIVARLFLPVIPLRCNARAARWALRGRRRHPPMSISETLGLHDVSVPITFPNTPAHASAITCNQRGP